MRNDHVVPPPMCHGDRVPEKRRQNGFISLPAHMPPFHSAHNSRPVPIAAANEQELNKVVGQLHFGFHLLLPLAQPINPHPLSCCFTSSYRSLRSRSSSPPLPSHPRIHPVPRPAHRVCYLDKVIKAIVFFAVFVMSLNCM